MTITRGYVDGSPASGSRFVHVSAQIEQMLYNIDVSYSRSNMQGRASTGVLRVYVSTVLQIKQKEFVYNKIYSMVVKWKLGAQKMYLQQKSSNFAITISSSICRIQTRSSLKSWWGAA